jgi:hypothetical protein
MVWGDLASSQAFNESVGMQLKRLRQDGVLSVLQSQLAR